MQIKTVVVAICAVIAFESVSGYYHGGDNGQASYRFNYDVRDPQTQDIKSQFEQREGQQVIGQYSLFEPDGTQRVVRYRAGPQTGFEAVVERRGEAQHGGQFSQFGQGHHHGYGQNQGFGGGFGGSSQVGVTRWGNQGGEEGHYY